MAKSKIEFSYFSFYVIYFVNIVSSYTIPSSTNRAIPVDIRGVPINYRAVPIENRVFTINYPNFPANNPAAVQTENRIVPINYRGVPKDNRGVPTDNRGFATNYVPLPVNNRAGSKENRDVPTDNRGFTTNYVSLPVNNRAGSKENRHVPTDNGGFTTNYVSLPVNNRAGSKENRGVSTNNRAVTTNNRPVSSVEYVNKPKVTFYQSSKPTAVSATAYQQNVKNQQNEQQKKQHQQAKQTQNKNQKPVKTVKPNGDYYKKPVANQKITKSKSNSKKQYEAPVTSSSAPSKYEYAALQAAKIAYAAPVVAYATPTPIIYASPQPTTKTFHKTRNQEAWKDYQKQLQQWQIAVLNGYQPQQDNQQPPGNVYIHTGYYPDYYPNQFSTYPQPAQGYPQPYPQPYPQQVQVYPQPIQPYPQPAQPYPQRPYPQPEPAEQVPNNPANQEGSTVVEAAQTSETPNSGYPQPSQPSEQPEIPIEQPSKPENPQEQLSPSQPQQPSEYPGQPQPEVPTEVQPTNPTFGPDPTLPNTPESPEQPEQSSEQPGQPLPEGPQPGQESEVPSPPPTELQPIYPPIGPDPTLPEVDNGIETYPGQPPLLPVTTEYPSTTDELSGSTPISTIGGSGVIQYCQSPRGQYPSPNSCSKYINCWDDVAIEQECPSGLLFGESTCDYPQNVDCGERPLPPLEAVSGEGHPGVNGTTECPSSFGTFKSNKNCGAFIVCVAGEAYEFACPGGTNYNDHLKVCDYPYRVDCGDLPPNPIPIQPEEGINGSTEIEEPVTPQPEYPNKPDPLTQPYPEQPIYPENPSLQPEYPSPSQPEQPSYPSPVQPEQPSYPSPGQPEQPSYPSPGQPEQPSYPSPVQPGQPSYPSPGQPEQPSYPSPVQPEQPGSPSPSQPEQPTQPEYPPPTGTPVNENPVDPDLPPSYFNNQYYNYQVKRVPSSFSNTGIRCNTKKVYKLSGRSCDAVSICRGGFTHVVNCSPGTGYDIYSQKCIASYRAKC